MIHLYDMHYKIYFENKPVFLLDSLDQEMIRNFSQDRILFVNEISDLVVKNTLSSVRSDNTDAVIFFHKNIDELKKAFWKQFTIIQAGGGLVQNEQQQILFIFRRGKWDLPKGKLDPDESLQECAIREVQEETGLQSIMLENHLLTTYHTYRKDNMDILKETHWYVMKASSDSILTAQAEEDIQQVEWVEVDDTPKMLQNTYQAIKDVLSAFANGNTDDYQQGE